MEGSEGNYTPIPHVKSSRKFTSLLIVLLLVFSVLGLLTLVAIKDKSVLTRLGLITPTPTPKKASVTLKTEYENPFDTKTQYVNPFSQYKNPFDSVK